MTEVKNTFRHELKYIITESEAIVIQNRLKLLMKRDSHANENGYFIRSLYFDDRDEQAFRDKIDGVNSRKKYRIRFYDYDDSYISLECKEKEGNYINKVSARLSRDDLEKILHGDYSFLKNRNEQVCKDFYIECALNGMKPNVIVDYDRIPYVYTHGDVRITFDSHVRSSFAFEDIFDCIIPVYEVLDPGTLIMEVKYTEYCPTIIRELLQPSDSIYTSASKYAMCIEKKNELMNIKR